MVEHGACRVRLPTRKAESGRFREAPVPATHCSYLFNQLDACSLALYAGTRMSNNTAVEHLRTSIPEGPCQGNVGGTQPYNRAAVRSLLRSSAARIRVRKWHEPCFRASAPSANRRGTTEVQSGGPSSYLFRAWHAATL